MYYTMKDFKEKRIAVSFKNKWEQKRFLKECEKEGLQWLHGQKPTEFEFPVNECIYCGAVLKEKLTRGRKEGYEEEGCQVVKFNQILFGNWKEVERVAKKGEYIKLTNPTYTFDKEGDILKVDEAKESLIYVKGRNHKRKIDGCHNDDRFWAYEEYDYVVLERKDDKMSKFKVGDKVVANVKGEKLYGEIVETEGGCGKDMNLVKFYNWNEGHNGNGFSKKTYKGDSCWYLYDYELKSYKEGENIMKKSDLRNGAIVELRKGDKYMLFLDVENSYAKNMLVSLKDGGYLDLDDYNDDLKDSDNAKYDIVKICQNDYVGDNIHSHILKQDEDDWTWVREEEVVMTISEIEKKLGIENLKIKKED